MQLESAPLGEGVGGHVATGEPRARAVDSAVGRRWSFGAAVLDDRTLELSVNGSVVRIERKPLEVLLYLLHHAGEVVTKDELAENIWPGRILTESVLTRCVSQLRQVLQDDDRKVIRTVHGFGYRLVAEVRIDTTKSAPLPVFAFKAGDRPPQRPQWHLVERLGTGGHGEAWLARHDKTGVGRVFKFALDAAALVSLKREITLYRLLHHSLEERAAVVPILDWNLEEAPYFIETEYLENRDLAAWAVTRGGLAEMPLAERLELMAQIAEALGAAHSVGVLHKDLKPGNVLVKQDLGGAPRICLCDFGSGGVLDTGRLDALGITNLGFTRTLAGNDATGATPLYLAPEIVSGQPFTVAADVYALGVMLYQVVTGDLRRPLAPGWELNVEDELLREDIALAAAGEPSRRMADAAQLAIQLRTLEARHQVRAAEVAAREKAARTQRVIRELRRMRALAIALFLLAFAAIINGVIAYRALSDAESARATTQAVNDFLIEGLLTVDPSAEKPKNASYESLLVRAASQVDARFGEQPEAAARIHWLLGRRFQELGRVNEARGEYEKAATLLPLLSGADALPALLSMNLLVPIYSSHGLLREARDLAVSLLDSWKREFGARDLSTLLLRTRLARTTAQTGHLQQAEAEFQAIFAELRNAPPPTEVSKPGITELLGLIFTIDAKALVTSGQIADAVHAFATCVYAGYLVELAEDYKQAEVYYRGALPVLTRLFGQDSEPTAMTHMGLGFVIGGLGRLEESSDHLAIADSYFDDALPSQHWLRVPMRLLEGRLALERERSTEAIEILEKAMGECSDRCPPGLIEEIRYDLARAYDQNGQIGRAIEVFKRAISQFSSLRGAEHLGTIRRQLSLADALLRTDKLDQAESVFAQIEPSALSVLPPPHLVVADHQRIKALLIRKESPGRAVTLLRESLNTYELRLGRDHRRTQRRRFELTQFN